MRGPPVTAIDAVPTVESDSKPVRRIKFAQAILSLCAIVIVGQLVRVQVIDRHVYMEEMAQGLPGLREVASERGAILDRNGAYLALNNYEFRIEAAPNQIPEAYTADVATQLAKVLHLPQRELQDKLSGDNPWVQISPQVSRDVGKAVDALNLQGITAIPTVIRVYPESNLAAHVLGFVAADGKGYYGVEGFYDSVLRGEAGLRDDRWNPWSQPVSFTDRRAGAWKLPEEGHTLVLTIDRTIQYLVEQELENAIEEYGAERGCIVVMDPKTGALIAMASYPAYDPSQYSQADSGSLVDPIIGEQYEPGSIFKIVTMAAALDTGTVRPTDVYNDIGYIEVGGRILRNWDNQSYGPTTMVDVMVHSLNTGMAHVSTLLGPSRFYRYVERFGFGRKAGVDLQGEAEGIVREQGDPEWYESDLGTNAFGQGLAVTPLQMVAAAGVVANHGFLMQPYVVQQMIEGGRVVNAKPVTVRQVIGEETVRILTDMMLQVVERSAVQAQVEGYQIAGKTGTAQTPIVGGYDPSLTIASFVGFAPVDDPQFVVLVKLDKPTSTPWAATTAAPTFANVARILFTHLSIPPSESKVAAQ
jgi:cell division protein FtsI/penicillin-binding protein 2